MSQTVTAAKGELRLLGEASVRMETRHIPLNADKRHQLLAYLAWSGDWVSREKLADLFWSETTSLVSRRNLRQVLSRALELGWLEGLEVEPQRLRWRVESDLKKFREALETGNIDQVLGCYGGKLLAGLESYEENQYAFWLDLERQSLHLQWRRVVFERADGLAKDQHFERAAALLKRLLEQDELDEEAIRAYMTSLSQAGQSERALEAYQSFVKTLGREMGLSPTSTTEQLAQNLSRAPQKILLPAVKPTSDLPLPATSFVGRELERSEITHALTHSACRLLTLLGPGGVGKTRLALYAASELTAHFPEGVRFVALESLTTLEAIPGAVAAALGLTLQSHQPPLGQVSEFISDRPLLLVLDNFEGLIEGAPLLALLLAACPRLRLLVTSRARLNLEEEHVLPITGLGLPQDLPLLEEASAYDALELFAQRARRVQPTFALSPDTLPQVLEICRLVQGFPLGIELAAVWVRLMSCAEIAEEIRQNLDFLTSTSRNLEDRHKSLRATFDYSWRLLSPKEQAVLSKLAVFRGGFTRQAASAVAGANVALIAALLDKSLLQVGAEGRYDLHPLIQQYSQEQLASQEQIRNKHLEYFLCFCEAAEKGLHGPEQGRWIGLLEDEHDNLRWALGWALEHPDPELALRLAASLMRFWHSRSYLSEGRRWLEAALARSSEETLLYARALGAAGVMAWGQADHPAARSFAERRLRIHQRYKDRPGMVAALLSLGNIIWDGGEPGLAKTHYQKSIALARELADQTQVARASNNLANLLKSEGDLAGAQNLLETSLSIERQIGAPGEIALTLINLGRVALGQGNYSRARGLIEEALPLIQQAGNQWGLVHALSTLGDIALSQKEFALARGHFSRCLELRRKSGDRTGLAYALNNLAEVALREGEMAKAKLLLEEGQQLMQQTGNPRGEAVLASKEGRLARLEGDYPKATPLQQHSLATFAQINETLGVIGSLAELAATALAQKEFTRSVKLQSAAQALLEKAKGLLPMAESDDWQQVKQELHEQLNQADFERYWEDGAAMTLEESIAYASLKDQAI